MRSTIVKLAGLAAAGVAGTALAAGPSYAAPSSAPNLTTGTATCTDGMSYTFVAQGDNGQGQNWSVAFLTGSDGSQALFRPASLDLTFTAPDGTSFHEQVMKHSGTGPVSCDITGSPVAVPTATLTGTVTGTIVPTGG